MTHYFTWNNPRILLVVSLLCLVLLAPHMSVKGDVSFPVSRWMQVQANSNWTNPTNIYGAPDTTYAVCALEGAGCWEYGWNATPIVPEEGWVVISVTIGFTFFSATLGNVDDIFYLKWGIGDVGIAEPPSEWTTEDVITAGSAPATRTYNITADLEVWTWDDIYNLYLMVEGHENLQGGDDLTFSWDSAYVEYIFYVPPEDDPNTGSGGVKECDFQPTIDGYNVSFWAQCDRADALILHWIWDFGDGTVLYDDGSTTEHEYSQTGTFNVSLEVVDHWGHTASVSKWVTVEGNSPSGFYWSGMVQVIYWLGAAVILMVILVMLARRWKKQEET